MRHDFSTYFAALTIVVLVLSPAPSAGQTSVRTIATEPFEYTPGPVAGANGGSGFASPWTGAGTVTTPTLEWPQPGGFLGSGGKLTTAGGNAGAFRSLTGRYGDDGTRVILRVLARGRASAGLPDYGGISLLDGAEERLFVGKTFGSPNWGIERTGQAAASSIYPVDADTDAFVCEIYFGAGATPGNEQVYLYFDPPLRSAAVTPRPNWIAALLDVNDFRFDTLRIQSGNGAASMDFDEIRIQLVVPEPAAALTLAGAAGLCALRRRR